MIDAAVADVRAIEAREGVSRQSLEEIKQRLIRLSGRAELFTSADFPPHSDIREPRSSL